MMEVVVVVEMKDEKEIIIHIFKVMKLYIIYIYLYNLYFKDEKCEENGE